MKKVVDKICLLLVAALLFSAISLKSVWAEERNLSISPESTIGIKIQMESPGKSYVLQGKCDDPTDLIFSVKWMQVEDLIRKDEYIPESEDLFFLVYAPVNADSCVIEIQNVSAQIVTVTGFDFSARVVSAIGEIMEVSDIQDISEPMEPEEFWNLFPPLDLPYPNRRIQQNPILRQYFDFGFNNTYEFGFYAPLKADEIMNVPVTTGMLGKTEQADKPTIIAGDIKFNPYMRRHSNYSSRYYPRTMNGYVERYFAPAAVLSKDQKYIDRMNELLDYLLYSQWQEDGSNAFVQEVYPEDYTPHPEWFGGFDYLFDWEWKDAYGYLWNLHEPDHHVNSSIAGTFVTAYQMTGNEQYFQAAYDFVFNQFPRYGFHKGTYKGETYYWSEYNPTGLTLDNPVTDPTDNINALTASACAKVGYYVEDPDLKARLLEMSKGLLWYMIREYDYDAWFYYDGAENPLNPRKAESHDSVCLRYAFTALAYLYKAGADIEVLLERFNEIEMDLSQKVADLKPLADLRLYKMHEGEPVKGNTVTFTYYILVKNSDLKELSITDAVPPSFKAKDYINFRISKLNPPDKSNSNYTVGDDIVFCSRKEQMQKGVWIPFEVERGDVLRVVYDVVCTKTIDSYKINSATPKVRATKVTKGKGTAVTYTTNVRAEAFNLPFCSELIVNPGNFFSLAAMTNFPFEDETGVGIVDRQRPRCMMYRENGTGVNGDWYMTKPLIQKENQKNM
ncbi:MAG TPA: hypothetical protein DDZ89_09430 [Clostridiales bacterium]|nr:hypothetical protein [Clostridiales bacterium]